MVQTYCVRFFCCEKRRNEERIIVRRRGVGTQRTHPPDDCCCKKLISRCDCFIFTKSCSENCLVSRCTQNQPYTIAMYYDLYLPFPLPPSQEDTHSKKAKKGKGKAPVPPLVVSNADCWDGLETSARESVARRIALTGHCE